MPRVTKEELDKLPQMENRPVRWTHRLICQRDGAYLSVGHGTIPAETVAFYQDAHAGHPVTEEHQPEVAPPPS